MSVPEITFPSLLWRRCRDGSSTNASDPVELARTPTWPATLPSPRDALPAACTQPNLYLQLSQILEWEIWNHNQTRAQLYIAQTRCNEMDAEIWRLSQIASQWEEACRTAHAALDEHRMEHIKLAQELEATAAELQSLQQKTFTAYELCSSCDENSSSLDTRFEFVEDKRIGAPAQGGSADGTRK